MDFLKFLDIRRFFLLALIGSTSVLTSPAKAVVDWTAAETYFGMANDPLIDPYFASIRDVVHAQISTSMPIGSGLNVETVHLKNSNFDTEAIRVGLSSHKTLIRQAPTQSYYFTHKAPLLVFMPGVQQGLDHPYVKWMAYVAKQQGSHFLAIPAPFSADYRNQYPKYAAGSIEKEAEIAKQAIQSAIQKIGAENVHSVHVVGLSYGAFMGAIISTLEPIVSKQKITLLALPHSMPDIIRKLDELMNKELSPYPYDYSNLRFLGIVGQYNISKSSEALEEVAAKSRQGFAWAFQSDQVEIALYLHARFGCNWDILQEFAQQHSSHMQLPLYMSNMPKTSPEYHKLYDNVRFANTIQNCTPQNVEFYASGKATAHYWLERAHSSLKKHLTLVYAQDDELIASNKWDRELTQIDKDITVIPLPFGGHTGFFFTTWMQKLLSE